VTDQVPSELVAGDTWTWTRELSDYLAPTWSLTYYFVNATHRFSATSTASSTSHLITITAATSAGYSAGRYRWTVRATDGSSIITVEDGWVDVAADPSKGTVDPRSDARKMLDAINAFLIGNASTAQASMSINGRSLSRWALSDIRAFKTELEQRVRTEEGGSRGSRNINVRLTRV
jgi:hypothetical protein